jgi:CSLREA domain-containing protein
MIARKWIAVFGAALTLALIAPGAATATTFTVNTTADTTVAGGCVTEPACSLRDAVTAAGNSAEPEDRVEIPAGTYLLTAGQLNVFGGGLVTLHGVGARSTIIDAQGQSRVLEFSGARAALEGVTVTGGSAPATAATNFPGDGAGVLVVAEEQVTFNQVTVSGNSANLNGAGVSAPPESVPATALVFNGSTISGNRVTGGAAEGQGGGIYAYGDLTMTNSTVAGNSVDNAGLSQGGGVLGGMDPSQLSSNTVNLLNTTIAGNSVAAGGVGGGFTINNPTAGVVTALNVKNTIVAGNTAGGTPADCGAVVAATSADNISGDASCQFTDPGSHQNTNPLLGALANNGGPTDTMALQPGSPAIDAGTSAGCPATDQRGVARPQGSACDVGAFELVPTPPIPAKPSADLKLKLKAKPKHPAAGHKLAFLIDLSNRGPGAAPGVVIKGTVPAAATKIKAKKVAGKPACKLRKAKRSKRRFVCRLGTLSTGAKRKLKIVVVTSPGARGKLRASARVSSRVSDPRRRNNRSKVSVRLKAS